MRVLSIVLVLLTALVVVGCEKKTASEQLKADFNKASKELNKEMQGLTK